jgi:hypothetical protein
LKALALEESLKTFRDNKKDNVDEKNIFID